MTEPLDIDTPQGHRAIRATLEAFIADLDYDLHKGILRGEDDGLNRYGETTNEFIELLRRHLPTEAGPSQAAQPLDLDAIQARCDAATPGPWHVEDDKRDLNRWVADRSGYLEINFGYLNNGTQSDARFVAHARTDVERLLARVRELEAENERLAKHADELATEIAEGISAQTMLKGLTVEDGRVCLSIEPAREMLLILVASMREMLDDAGAENYLTTEATFPPEVCLDLQDGQHPEDSYTLTVQRRHRPTAHDLRRHAEAEVERLTTELARCVGKEPTVAEEMAELNRRLDAVDTVLTQWNEHCVGPQTRILLDDIRAAANGETQPAT